MNRPTRFGIARVNRAIALAVVCVLLSGWQSAAVAELVVREEQTDEGTRTIFQMTITPAAEPQPPLRHRLVVREIDLQPGNAASQYARAFPESGIESRFRRLVEQYGESLHDWYRIDSVSLKDLPLDQARKAAAEFDFLIHNYIAPATLRRECDWGLELEGMTGTDIVALALPDFQATRNISRALALRARVAIADGDYESAIDQLRMNYRLAENVAREPLLVCALIGMAEASIGNQQVIELIAAKNSPNLYWALAELPDPMIDIRKAAQFEASLALRISPILEDAETANHVPQEWARLLADAFGSTESLTGEHARAQHFEMRQAALAGVSLVVYPAAKQRLTQDGMTKEDVDAMPVGQVLAIDALHEYQKIAQEIEKWGYVPYHVARTRDPSAMWDAQGPAALVRGYGYILAKLMLPTLSAVRSAAARLEWQMRALQAIEAVRMHAAETGTLPPTLEAIQMVPVPRNPATDLPYDYRSDGKTAVLDLPFSDGFHGLAWRFEISLAEANEGPEE